MEQYPINFFFECGAVSFDLVEQYPKSISKGPRLRSGQTVDFLGNCTRVGQGVHKGRTVGAQGAQSACFFPTFLLFKLER